MCGFIGRIVVDRARVAGELADALPLLQRRGPDSCATWQSEDGQLELLRVISEKPV